MPDELQNQFEDALSEGIGAFMDAGLHPHI
jgi:hypothetical protein